MPFRVNGSPPWAAFSTPKPPPASRPDPPIAGRVREAWLSPRQTGAEITAGLAFTLFLIAWIESGFLTPPDPWDDFALGVIAAALGCLMLVLLRRQKRSVAELRRNEKQLEEQRALLQSTLENMGEGLSVFDCDGRLIAWNARFASLLKFPGPLTNAALYDVMLHQARRGDFGPVADP
jgi:PAS domain-containing protein